MRDRRAAVVGWPVAHSQSPRLFAALAAAAGVPLVYRAQAVPPGMLAEALATRGADEVGWNVTLPHKEAALALAGEATPRARAAGAANVLTFRDDGVVVADNTDGDGVAATVAHAGIAVAGAHVLILGAGGAARAVVVELARLGAASLAVVNRDAARAQRLVAQLAPLCAPAHLHAPADPVAAARGARVVVDATARSRDTTAGAAFDDAAIVAACAAGALAFDLTYGVETPFLRAARAANRRAIDGTVMLEAQAAATFARWFPLVTAP